MVFPTVRANADGYTHVVTIDTDNIEHGTVTPVNFNDGNTYQEGYRVLMTATPDDGYKLAGWNVKAFASGRTIDVEVYQTYYSFVIPVFPSSQRRQYIYISAIFEEKDPDEPDGPYHVDVYSPDHNGTGSSISVDHEDGNYNAGDEVSVRISWAPGTHFSDGGLTNFEYTDKNNQVHKIQFTKINNDIYTFIMPAVQLGTDVRLSCFFDFIQYKVTYETDFGNAQVSDEDRANLPTKKPKIYLYNSDSEQRELSAWPLTAHRGQQFRVDTFNEDAYCCTGIIAEYLDQGVPAMKDIVKNSGYGQMREVYDKMEMPASNVTLKLKMEKLLYIRTVATPQGEITTDISRAKPGDRVKITVTPAPSYACTGVKVTDANGENVPVSGDNIFVMPDTDVTVTATYNTAYLDRWWDGEKVMEQVKPVYEPRMVEITSVANHTLQDGDWYIVRGDTTFNERLTVNGNVRIVLCDGAK